MEDGRARIQEWLRWCLGEGRLKLESYRALPGYSNCEIVACETDQGTAVLKVYAADLVDYARLGPVATARKHALVLQELPALGVPTPRFLGFASRGEEAALAMEWIDPQPLTARARLEAARVLARLHAIPLCDLSRELADLVVRSTPNRSSPGEVPGAPPKREETLQHGDYYAPNLAVTGEGVRVMDWDFLALGDPMCDLAFLLRGDMLREERERVDVEAGILAYQNLRPVDFARLDWHLACFQAYWQARGEGG